MSPLSSISKNKRIHKPTNVSATPYHPISKINVEKTPRTRQLGAFSFQRAQAVDNQEIVDWTDFNLAVDESSISMTFDFQYHRSENGDIMESKVICALRAGHLFAFRHYSPE